MTVLHVREQGAVVQREVELIKVVKRQARPRKETLLNQIAVHELEQVVLYGNVQVTTQAAALLVQKQVDVVFLGLGGKFRYRLVDEGSKFAKLRHAQLKLSGDEARSLTVAKAVVQAKLTNQARLLQRLAEAASNGQRQQMTRAAQQIEQLGVALTRAKDADTLRGFEGKAGADYFGSLKGLLEPGWGFQGRAYHPPPDAFNVLLSFGYALLLKDVTAMLQLVGLDPYLGCLHALEYGRPSLALDLMEEFRPLVVDQVMIQLVLTGKIKVADFTFTGQEERPVELGEKPMPLVIAAYEQRLDETVLHPAQGDQQKLRRCLELQARSYGRVVLGMQEVYTGVVSP